MEDLVAAAAAHVVAEVREQPDLEAEARGRALLDLPVDVCHHRVHVAAARLHMRTTACQAGSPPRHRWAELCVWTWLGHLRPGRAVARQAQPHRPRTECISPRQSSGDKKQSLCQFCKRVRVTGTQCSNHAPGKAQLHCCGMWDSMYDLRGGYLQSGRVNDRASYRRHCASPGGHDIGAGIRRPRRWCLPGLA